MRIAFFKFVVMTLIFVLFLGTSLFALGGKEADKPQEPPKVQGQNGNNQDFNMAWAAEMSLYIGRGVRSIPDAYELEDDKKTYLRPITENVYEGFIAVDNTIMGAMWMKNINNRRLLYSEYERYIMLLTTELGEPFFEDQDSIMWVYVGLFEGLVITMGVDENDGYVIAFLSLPEMVGIR
jgi:hypothetical protein